MMKAVQLICRQHLTLALLGFFVLFATGTALAQTKPSKKTAAKTSAAPAYQAEARLIDVYKQIGAGHSKEALRLATELTTDYPNFQLAQLIYGDLLRLQTKPIATFGDVPPAQIKNGAASTLEQLRNESALRIRGLTERPPAGTIPNQVLSLAARNKHVIAVDASKARLYLLENTGQGLRLLADYYVSVGQNGIDKFVEGDNKTPLGVYYLTSTPDPKGLPPLYGGGALPINYPNPYDLRRGKTGSGIWFHGSPPEQFARLPKASNGCIVLSNPDLNRLMAQVAIRTTPVIIAQQLLWVTPATLVKERQEFEEALGAWRLAKNTGDSLQLKTYYLEDFSNYGKSLSVWWPSNVQELDKAARKPFVWKDATALIWRTEQGNKSGMPVMVLTYDETNPITRQTLTKRQYWLRTANTWKIFFEGVVASS